MGGLTKVVALSLLFVFSLLACLDFDLEFPRNGDWLITTCNLDDDCFATIFFYGRANLVENQSATNWTINLLINGEKTYSVNKLINLRSESVRLSVDIEMKRGHINYAQLSFLLLDRTVIVSNITRTLVPIYESDVQEIFVGIQSSARRTKVHSRRLDFLEIGTNDFDTCIELAHEAYNEVGSPIFSGISVDPISMYLNGLPNVQQVQKLRVAIIQAASKQHHSVPIFYIPPSLIFHMNFSKNFQGSAMVNWIHPHIDETIQSERLPMGFIQRDYVPAMTLAALIEKHVTAGQNINLLKLDMEGLDQPIVGDMVDYYEHKSRQYHQHQHQHQLTDENKSGAVRPPCVIFFETIFRLDNGSTALLALYARLRSVGYRVLSVVDNALAVDCSCTQAELDTARFLLPSADISLDDFATLCRA